MSTIQYYSCIPASRIKPTTIFRFHESDEKTPERYVVSHRWVEDTRLYNLLATGELTDENKISEKQAISIINELDHKHD